LGLDRIVLIIYDNPMLRDNIQEIKKLIEMGVTMTAIAKRFKVSRMRLYQVVGSKKYNLSNKKESEQK